jgi:hypothetical protein
MVKTSSTDGMVALLQENCLMAVEQCYQELLSFVRADVPDVLKLLASSLSNANLPDKLGDWETLSTER